MYHDLEIQVTLHIFNVNCYLGYFKRAHRLSHSKENCTLAM